MLVEDPQAEERMLRAALGRLGGRGGPGARLAARFLRTDVHELQLWSGRPAADTVAAVLAEVGRHGNLVGRGRSPGDGQVLRALVGSGGLDLNPTVVTVHVVPHGTAGCDVHVRAAAKEGLIRQHAARKAARRLAAALAG